MIIPDLNMVVYAHNARAARHEAARRWWEGLLDGEETVGIPLAVSVGFIRLATSPVVLSPPMSSRRAVSLVQDWLRRPHFVQLDSGSNHFNHLAECLEAAGRAGKLVTDAHLAALALDHDAEIHTADRDFRLFPNVRWLNPLGNDA